MKMIVEFPALLSVQAQFSDQLLVSSLTLGLASAFIFPSEKDTPILKENYQQRILTPLANSAT